MAINHSGLLYFGPPCICLLIREKAAYCKNYEPMAGGGAAPL